MRVDTSSYLMHSMREAGIAQPQIFEVKNFVKTPKITYTFTFATKSSATVANGPTPTMDHSKSSYQKANFRAWVPIHEMHESIVT